MICKQCGKPNHKTASFCVQCGEPLVAGGAPAEPPALRTEEPLRPANQAVEDFTWSDKDVISQPETSGRAGRGKDKAGTTTKTTHETTYKTKQETPKKHSPKQDHKEDKNGKKQSTKASHSKSKDKKHSSGNRSHKSGVLIRTAKLALGLATIFVFVLIAYRAYGSGAFHAVFAEIPDLSGVISLWPAALMLLAGIITLSMRDSRFGGILSGAVYICSTVAGIFRPGYSLRPINWPFYALFFGAAAIFLSLQPSGGHRKKEKTVKTVRTEKRGGGFWGFLLVVLFLLIGAAIAVGVYIVNNSPMDEGEGNTTGMVTQGQTFTFDGLEMTFHSDIQWKTLSMEYSDKHGSDVFAVPLTVRNGGDETNGFNYLSYTQYGSNGTPLEKIGSHFSDDVMTIGDLSPGQQQTANMHFLFDGDGNYYVNFEDAAGAVVEVRIPIQTAAEETSPSSQQPESSQEASSTPSSSAAESSAPSSSSSPSSASESSTSSTSSPSSAADDVTVLVPAAFLDSGISENLTDQDRANGIRSVRINADGSATIVVSSAGHETMRRTAEESIRTYTARMRERDSAIRDIRLNGAMTEAEITVDRSGGDRDVDPALLAGLYYEAGYYQALEGRAQIALSIRLLDGETGETYQALNYPGDL